MNKTPISIALERQIPEFIREDYKTFVEFIKAYYQFLEETQQRNLEDIRSIEHTLDEFIIRFKKELSIVFPTNALVNERFILQHIRDFYKTRGSPESFQFLFRALFNKEAEIYYPSKQILRASNGSWIQEKSLFVESISGDLFNLGGQIITIKTAKKSISVFCTRVVYYRENTYEVFIDRAYVQDISISDSVLSNDMTVSGAIIPCPAKYTITSAGSGFEIGGLYHLPSESGNGSLIKITKIDGSGAIKKIQVITFGLDYKSTFYAKLSNKTRQAFSYYSPITSFTVGSGHPSGQYPTTSYSGGVPATDGTTGYVDLGYINKQDYFAYDSNYLPSVNTHETVFYADGTYVGEILGSFYTNETNTSIIDGSIAEISIELGAVAIYPGYYSKSDGFISDECYIQDGNYYQLFSYVIKVEQQIETYRDIIKSLLHPAGFAMFAEYNIKNTYLLSASPLNAFIRRQFTDQQYVTDDDAANAVYKFLEDIEATIHLDSTDIKDVTKLLADSEQPIESKYYDMLKGSANDPVENSIAIGTHSSTVDIKNVTKPISALGDLLENTIAIGTHSSTVDIKNVTKLYNLDTITSYSMFDQAQDKKDVAKGSVGDPIENAIAIGTHSSINDIKDVTKLSTDTSTANHDLVNDIKDVTRLSVDASTANHDLVNDIKDVTRLSVDASTANHDAANDIKDVTKLSIDTSTANHDPVNDIKDVTRSSVDTYSTVDSFDRTVAYFRDKLYLNYDSTYPFNDATTVTIDQIGQRDVANAGAATYYRDASYTNYSGDNPFNSITSSLELISNNPSRIIPSTDSTFTAIGGEWAWNGTSYDLINPEVRIGILAVRSPDLFGFQATLTAGLNTVTLTTGTTVGLFPGQLFTKVSGSGEFGVMSRISSIVDYTNFTVTVVHATSGAIAFTGNGDGLADSNTAFNQLINIPTTSGTLYYNVYNQNSATDPNTSYSYEAETYSVHDTRAIS